MVVKIDDASKLTVAEKERLKQMLAQEKSKYKDEASRRFNSAKNRSIMIQDVHNDMRNEVMRRIYSRQLEKRRTGNFKIHAINQIKEETKKAETIAAEKIEEERTAASNNGNSFAQDDSEFAVDSLIATSDLMAKAKRENLSLKELYNLLRNCKQDKLRP